MPRNEEDNPYFPPRATPNWLRKIISLYRNERNDDLREQMKNSMKEQMKASDICEILTESLYYSASGNDITPISFFEKHIHSFVFCLDTTYNLGYETEFENIKTQLRSENHRKRVNINLSLDELIRNGWLSKDDWFDNNSNRFKANWSIWQHEDEFLSLLFVSCDSQTLWKNFYKKNGVCPKVFFFQGWLDGWKGGLGENEDGTFVVNSEIYCDGINVFRNKTFKQL